MNPLKHNYLKPFQRTESRQKLERKKFLKYLQGTEERMTNTDHHALRAEQTVRARGICALRERELAGEGWFECTAVKVKRPDSRSDLM
ncbi:hypothetical protein QQF64_035708 [Cirrhinus molitorella]|uniref:Uncharacterized protein n=1 Tax=Cirrhinus molitorella TaxID=172907 RepID=A0ABR3NHI1_9TELE